MRASVRNIRKRHRRYPFFACLVILGLFIREPALSAIVFDRASSTFGNTATLTWSHTVGIGTDRILVVGVSIRNAGRTVSSITYAGINLTPVGSQNSATNTVRMEMWYLLNPPEGTANVIINLSANAAVVAGAASYFGVDPIIPFGTFTSATATSANASTTVASAPGDLVVDVVAAQGNSASLFMGGGQLSQWNAGTGITASDIRGASSSQPGASTVTMSWTLLTARAWAIGAIALMPTANPNLILTLSQNNGTPPPGATVTYTMTYQNTGVGLATSTLITLPVPANTSYEANSVRLNGVAKTDAPDADEVTLSGSAITVNLGAVPTGGSGTITYNVIIQ